MESLKDLSYVSGILSVGLFVLMISLTLAAVAKVGLNFDKRSTIIIFSFLIGALIRMLGWLSFYFNYNNINRKYFMLFDDIVVFISWAFLNYFVFEMQELKDIL